MTRSPDENHHLAQVLRLFLEHQPALRSYGISIVPDSSLVPDVIQETVEIRAGGEKEGRRVLRFLRAEREPVLARPGAGSCDVYPLVDPRTSRARNRSGNATLELSARFLDSRESVGAPMLFLSRV